MFGRPVTWVTTDHRAELMGDEKPATDVVPLRAAR
jgi:hypothetical protein